MAGFCLQPLPRPPASLLGQQMWQDTFEKLLGYKKHNQILCEIKSSVSKKRKLSGSVEQGTDQASEVEKSGRGIMVGGRGDVYVDVTASLYICEMLGGE